MTDMIVLIEPLIPALRRYARSLMRDRSAADDLLQDCLERAVSHWHQRRDDGNARTWMFTILHNLAINRLQQTARRGVHLDIDDVSDPALSGRPAQEDALHQQDVLRALKTLPEEQRNVILLISVEDLSYAETAKVLGVPIGTVMSRLARGRERLRQVLEGEVNNKIENGPHLRRVK